MRSGQRLLPVLFIGDSGNPANRRLKAVRLFSHGIGCKGSSRVDLTSTDVQRQTIPEFGSSKGKRYVSPTIATLRH